LCPLPEVFPSPEPSPRPSRFRGRFEPGFGFRLCSPISSERGVSAISPQPPPGERRPESALEAADCLSAPRTSQAAPARQTSAWLSDSDCCHWRICPASPSRAPTSFRGELLSLPLRRRCFSFPLLGAARGPGLSGRGLLGGLRRLCCGWRRRGDR